MCLVGPRVSATGVTVGGRRRLACTPPHKLSCDRPDSAGVSDSVPDQLGSIVENVELDLAAAHLEHHAWKNRWQHGPLRVFVELIPNRRDRMKLVFGVFARPSQVLANRHLDFAAVNVDARAWWPAAGGRSASIVRIADRTAL